MEEAVTTTPTLVRRDNLGELLGHSSGGLVGINSFLMVQQPPQERLLFVSPTGAALRTTVSVAIPWTLFVIETRSVTIRAVYALKEPLTADSFKIGHPLYPLPLPSVGWWQNGCYVSAYCGGLADHPAKYVTVGGRSLQFSAPQQATLEELNELSTQSVELFWSSNFSYYPPGLFREPGREAELWRQAINHFGMVSQFTGYGAPLKIMEAWEKLSLQEVVKLPWATEPVGDFLTSIVNRYGIIRMENAS